MLKEMRYSRKQGEENKGIRFIFYTPPLGVHDCGCPFPPVSLEVINTSLPAGRFYHFVVLFGSGANPQLLLVPFQLFYLPFPPKLLTLPSN
jgi:hypothetical protein